MIVLRTVFACDRRTLGLISMTNNLKDVPSWLAGNSLSLSKWNVEIRYSSTETEIITNLSYPIEIHWESPTSVDLNRIRLYREVGPNELYFDIQPSAAYGSKFDFYIEFVEKSDTVDEYDSQETPW
jgi:hypothetical protein